MAEGYAWGEAGIIGAPECTVLSEAGNIPVVVLGELLDPEGESRRSLREESDMGDHVAKDHPFYGWTYQQVQVRRYAPGAFIGTAIA